MACDVTACPPGTCHVTRDVMARDVMARPPGTRHVTRDVMARDVMARPSGICHVTRDVMARDVTAHAIWCGARASTRHITANVARRLARAKACRHTPRHARTIPPGAISLCDGRLLRLRIPTMGSALS